jgi:uncharacterized membrane protein
MEKKSREAVLHIAFRVGILFKGIDGLLELLGGILFLAIPRYAVTNFIVHITRHELAEDPDDLLANSLRHTFAHLSDGTKLFVSAYLLGHGLVKLLIVAGLWADRRWVFPVAIVLLIAFIAFQAWRLIGHFSPGLLVFTCLDVVILFLVCHEYQSHFKNH